MKQISIMDSFLKKKPQSSSQDLTPGKQTDKQNCSSNGTSPTEKMITQARKDVNVSEFKQLINNGDFSYEKIIVEQPRKRRMEIDDDESPMRPIDREQVEPEMTDERPKSRRKPGPCPPPKSATKKQSSDIGRKSILMKEGNQEPAEELTDVTPEWALPQNLTDADGHRPGDPEYNPSTLYIPPNALKDLTETMKQYWRLKAENFDKIVLFKLGKFYELFYQDALIANRSFDLKWMGTKMHVGFPERCLQMYLYKFVQLGYKIVVIEQMETVDQMKERIGRDRSMGRRSQRTLNRSITQVITKGTIVSSMLDEGQYLPNYLVAVSKHDNMIGYALLEMGTNLIMVGFCNTVEDFKTMLFQTRPVQLLYDPDNLPLQIVDLMKQNWLNMCLSRLSNRDNSWHPMNSKNQIQRLVNLEIFPMPAIFETISKLPTTQEQIIYITLSGMFKYLKQVLKFDYIMSAVRFAFYEQEGSSMTMVMDSQALQHLEIFETPLGEKGSLFEKIDRTKTKFGKRLYRRWIMQPLLDVNKINQRLDAIQDLELYHLDRNRVADVLGKLPDLQKTINRLYHYSVKTAAQKAVHFEDVSGSRMKQFRQLMQHMTKSWYGVEILRKNKDKFKSQRLKQLLTITRKRDDNDDEETNEGLLPQIREQLAELEGTIKWQGDVPKPQPGLIESYDLLQQEVTNIKVNLEQYLDQVRKSTGISSLRYVHTKQRYQIEFPEELEKRRPPDSIFTSKKVGYARFITPESKKLVADLQYVEGHIKQQMGLFVGHFFQQFRKYQKTWEKYIEILAQLDCLISMSIFSTQLQGVRPLFTNKGFTILEAKHPCLNSTELIPNNIELNSKIMLLTGPNMGGKSTLLRTTCLNVIMAQTGLYVPAEAYECQIIDRIFTRIGASDKLQQGKSTFFIEMEQTKSIIKYGTSNSLAIIDELGRGTSTYDGMAIAYSVLLDLIQRVQCRCLFATHYHSLSKEFESMSEVKMKMMDSIIANDKVVFLYKLKEGRAEQSFGLNVAKMVKLPQGILTLAERYTQEMEEEIKKKDKYKKVKQALSFAIG